MSVPAWRTKRAAMAAFVCLVLLHALTPAARAQVRGDAKAGESILFQSIPSVLGASRFEQLVTEAPASVTVLTAQDIADHGWRTVADIIRTVRGFFVTYDRNYSYVGVRGFGRPGDYNGRVLLLMDGNRLNENVYDGGYVGTESLIDPASIDRIEIIRGPSSSLYGTNAFLAVLNIVTLRGRDAPGLSVEAEAGSLGTRSVRASAGRRFPNGVEAFASAVSYRSEGADLYFPELAAAGSNGFARSIDGDSRDQVLAKATMGEFTLEGAWSRRRKQVPTAAWGTTFGEPRFETLDLQSLIALNWAKRLANKSSVEGSLAFHGYDYEGSYPYEDVLSQDWSYGRWFDSEISHGRALGKSHRLVIGGSARVNLKQEQGAADAGAPPDFLDDTHHNVYALFAQDEWRPVRNVIVNAGIRYDHYSTFGGTTNPRIGLLWGASDGTMLKLLFGTAFRAPNNFEFYYADETTQKANPRLEPERMRTWEIEVQRQVTRWMRVIASVYRYDIQDLISLTVDASDDLLVFENLGAARALGVEAEIEAAFGSVTTNVSYAWQNAHDVESGERLTNSPAHLGKMRVHLPVARLGSVGGEVLAMSSRRTLDGGTTPGWAVANLNAGTLRFWRGLSLEGRIDNAFDRAYADPASEEHLQRVIPQDGRRFRVAVRYRF